MNPAPFNLSALDTHCDRRNFDCGSDVLNRYFREQVTQDMRRRITACFVAKDEAQNIAGFYTLASASLLVSDVPETLRKKLPRYPTLPAVCMGRLAIDLNFQKKGLGGALLADALHRAAHAEIAAYALLVDAKNETAKSFYQHHGFIALPDTALKLFMPLATAFPNKP